MKTKYIMKKSFLTFVLFAAAILIISSCGKNELRDVRALVTSVEMNGDTLKSMKATVGGDTLLFSLTDVRLNNGLMLQGDSVIVNYIDWRNDSLRALVITILPKAPHVIDLNAIQSDSLLTAPVKSAEDVADN